MSVSLSSFHGTDSGVSRSPVGYHCRGAGDGQKGPCLFSCRLALVSAGTGSGRYHWQYTRHWKNSVTLALHTNPSSAELHLNLGVALQASGKTGRAIHHFKKALALNPHYVKAYHNLGNALFDSGDTEAAINCYNKAVALDPAAYKTYNSLAVAYAHLGNMRKAKACLQKALLINPAYYSARKNLEILRQLSKE
ncbi:MAG: hypothetical protein B5M56_04650 [Desulfococcus sp. 4484_241]|nr:MAG: hypothetical protein B5M56_04650 [Desulfococcus sp. 4484_241]